MSDPRVQRVSMLVTATYAEARGAVKDAIIELRKSVPWGDITVVMVAMSQDGMVMEVTAETQRTRYRLRMGDTHGSDND